MKRIVPHDPTWKKLFEAEAKQLSHLLKEHVTAIHHMGSTAIAGLPAKPTIDILIESASLSAIDRCADKLKAFHYCARGEYGIAGRRYFKKLATANAPAFHLHCYEVGTYQVKRHLAFRDFLRLKPELATEYANIKYSFCDADGLLMPNYQSAKKPWVDDISLQAMQFFSSP